MGRTQSSCGEGRGAGSDPKCVGGAGLDQSGGGEGSWTQSREKRGSGARPEAVGKVGSDLKQWEGGWEWGWTEVGGGVGLDPKWPEGSRGGAGVRLSGWGEGGQTGSGRGVGTEVAAGSMVRPKVVGGERGGVGLDLKRWEAGGSGIGDEASGGKGRGG